MLKHNNAYKTIGEVVKILDLKSKKKTHHQLILFVFGKRNLNKLNQKYLMVIEGIMMKKTLNC